MSPILAWILFFSMPVLCVIIVLIFIKKYRLYPISNWGKHYAVLFNDAGEQVDIIKIKFKEKTFKYEKKLYNFKPEDASKIIIKRFFKTHKLYIYNINNPDPFRIKKTVDPIMDPEVFKALQENELVKQLNELHDFNLFDWLKDPKHLIPVLLIGFAIWYFASGHDLGFLTGGGKDAVNSTITNVTTINSSVVRIK